MEPDGISKSNFIRGEISMRIGVIGCRFNTERFLQQLVRDDIDITLVATTASKIPSSEHRDLTSFCEEHDIPCLVSAKYQMCDQLVLEILKFRLDVIFCVGWQRLLPNSLIKSIPLGVFGMHGSHLKLPQGRGRSPQVWSIILGAKNYYAHIFKYTEGADEGEILYQQEIDITPFDTAKSLQIKSQIIFNQFLCKNKNNLQEILKKTLPQPKGTPSWFPKRTPEDGKIDWNQSASSIMNFIRAQTFPYPGAFTYFHGKKIVIWKCNIFDSKINSDHEAGIIIDKIEGEGFLVQCKVGLLLITEYDGCCLRLGEKFENEINYD